MNLKVGVEVLFIYEKNQLAKAGQIIAIDDRLNIACVRLYGEHRVNVFPVDHDSCTVTYVWIKDDNTLRFLKDSCQDHKDSEEIGSVSSAGALYKRAVLWFPFVRLFLMPPALKVGYNVTVTREKSIQNAELLVEFKSKIENLAVPTTRG